MHYVGDGCSADFTVIRTSLGRMGGTRILISFMFFSVSHGYLDGALHSECGELRHDHVHALQTGNAEFENLLFDYCLESQVRGEETRSERRGQKAIAWKQRRIERY